jgi:hypothetical protein
MSKWYSWSMPEEVIVPFRPSRETVAPLTFVRSTLLSSSFLALRARGLETRYLAELSPELHDIILYTPAGVWVPVAVALAHYSACDQLNLTQQQALEIGSNVAKVTQKSVLSTILRAAREVGATPWSLFPRCDQYWARVFQGSGISIFKLGPKEARFEAVACALAQSNYWRVGLRGLLTVVCEPFATKVYVREITAVTTPLTCGFRISWA